MRRYTARIGKMPLYLKRKFRIGPFPSFIFE